LAKDIGKGQQQEDQEHRLVELALEVDEDPIGGHQTGDDERNPTTVPPPGQ
jgi:hypothetical protein